MLIAESGIVLGDAICAFLIMLFVGLFIKSMINRKVASALFCFSLAFWVGVITILRTMIQKQHEQPWTTSGNTDQSALQIATTFAFVLLFASIGVYAYERTGRKYIWSQEQRLEGEQIFRGIDFSRTYEDDRELDL